MLVLTITNDNCIRIGDEQIRVSVSPFESDTAEFWIWPPEPEEGSCNSAALEYNARTVDEDVISNAYSALTGVSGKI